jgi:hypothetical protein
VEETMLKDRRVMVRELCEMIPNVSKTCIATFTARRESSKIQAQRRWYTACKNALISTVIMSKNSGKTKLSKNVLFNANKHVFHCENSLRTLFCGQTSYKEEGNTLEVKKNSRNPGLRYFSKGQRSGTKARCHYYYFITKTS